MIQTHIHYCVLGGNLGLFTGMSVLSFFEILFWIVQLVCRFTAMILCKKNKIGKKSQETNEDIEKGHLSKVWDWAWGEYSETQ